MVKCALARCVAGVRADLDAGWAGNAKGCGGEGSVVVCGIVRTFIGVVHGAHGEDALVFSGGDAFLLVALIGAMGAGEDLAQRALRVIFVLGCEGGSECVGWGAVA